MAEEADQSGRASEQHALWVEDLIAGYADQPLARLNRLELVAGAAGLLLGPSGSGKTTLLLAIAGLAQQLSGTVDIGGVKPASLKRRVRDRFRGREIGFIFQDIHLVTGLTVMENVLLAPFATGAAQDVERAQQLLVRLGIGDCARQPAETLSRGQAQRTAIARALLLRPRLILADEPTASLDDKGCSAVGSVLRTFASEECAALLIATHDHRLRATFDTVATVDALGGAS